MKRSLNGHFAKGNPGGTGNPFSKSVNRLRAVIYKEASPEKMTRVVRAMIKAAEGGDMTAAKELFDRVWGKSHQSISTEDVTERRAPTDEEWVAFYQAMGAQVDNWPAHLRAKFLAGKINGRMKE